jgi:hypothetical protein
VRPEAFTPNLALPLNNRAAMLSGVDGHEEALTAAPEAAVRLNLSALKALPEIVREQVGFTMLLSEPVQTNDVDLGYGDVLDHIAPRAD